MVHILLNIPLFNKINFYNVQTNILLNPGLTSFRGVKSNLTRLKFNFFKKVNKNPIYC
jgi:hypothetical protein